MTLLAVAAAVGLACETVPLTAPPGSSVFLQANPPFVVANGGRSVVTALVTEPAGTLVPDGTQCLFLTTLGTIDETGKTRDGIARVYFVADSRSGTATVTAICGAPAASTSSGTTSTAATGSGSATTEIDVGSALPAEVVVGADPQTITSPRRATIIANVFDQYGNPVQNVPVVFTIENPPATLQERLASGGAPSHTDSNGQAFDTLSTSTAFGAAQREVTIKATTANGKDGTVKVYVY